MIDSLCSDCVNCVHWRQHLSSAAPEALRDVGLVTSALWSDVDRDGWIDLLITLEWGPVKVFRNEKGVLKDATRREK